MALKYSFSGWANTGVFYKTETAIPSAASLMQKSPVNALISLKCFCQFSLLFPLYKDGKNHTSNLNHETVAGSQLKVTTIYNGFEIRE